MYKDLINNIIPADDLHWDEIEKRYVSLSAEETQEIILACMNQGINDLKKIYKVVSWCGEIRVGQLLWKNFLSGCVEISGFDSSGEPIFSPNKGNSDEN
jgi:hypothetical protein